MTKQQLATGSSRRQRLLGELLAIVLVTSTACTSTPSSEQSAPPTGVRATSSAFSTAPQVRFDSAHAQVDAHDGQLSEFDGVYYWYGTSYGCGFQWTSGTFCGFDVYTSTDLVTWSTPTVLFDPRGADWQAACAYGCFRPHVVLVQGRYVMWVNVANAPGKSYRVLTSSSPSGPFTYDAEQGRVAVRNAGDESLFVDDNGAAYIVMTDIDGKVSTNKSHEIVIQALSKDGLNATGPAHRLPGVGFVEAPALWKKGDTYHLAISDPACPYCTGVGITVFDSSSDPLDGWGKGYPVIIGSCGGQVTAVSTLTVDGKPRAVYQTDRWVRIGSDAITMNQALATQAWRPFDYDGHSVRPVTCDSSTTPDQRGLPTSFGLVAANSRTISSGDVTGRGQTATVWLARQRGAQGPVTVTVTATGGAEVRTTSLEAADLGWSLSPKEVAIPAAGDLTVSVSYGGIEGVVATGTTSSGQLAVTRG